MRKMCNDEEFRFTRPLPLLLPSDEGLKLIDETAEILEKIYQPIVVVAIAGKYRTGKSYILNLLSNLPRNGGFALGSTVESKTKGIWVYALPHPSLPNTTLLLMDTEGLGDVDKGDQHYDTTLLLLTILLSSTFILNVVGRLDDEVINQLGLVSALTKSMKTKADGGEVTEDFSLFFPQLFVLVRDFYLELRVNGKDISANDYFNHFCLKEKNSDGADNGDPRALIRKHFPKRTCFTVAPPVFKKELLQKLETVADHDLNPEFLEESQEFVKSVLSVSTPKAFTHNAPVDGKILVVLLRQYLEQIKNDSVPCIHTSLQSTVQLENKKILQEFVSKYKVSMRSSLTFPTSYITIMDTHQKLSTDFIQTAKQKIMFDSDKAKIENEYKNEIQSILKIILSENEEKSMQECSERLNQLSTTLNYKLNNNAFSRRGGHAEYSQEFQAVITNYNNVTEKGIKHDEVLSRFIKQKEAEGKRILAIEEQLVKAEQQAEAARKEKELAEERARLQQEMAEKARREAEEQRRLQEEMQRKLQQELEERKRQQAELESQMDEETRLRLQIQRWQEEGVCTIL